MRRSDTASFFNFLSKNELMFASAESCTGGLIARQMTARAGSSSVFWGGAVTYADDAKTRLLGVDAALILSDGAVSGPVALAMVTGLARLSSATLAVSTTGVAGPGGGSEGKPVGTVWVGLWAVRNLKPGSAAVRLSLSGSRAAIQRKAAQEARILARLWWECHMDLDSLRSLTNNNGKARYTAFHTPLPHPFDSF